MKYRIYIGSDELEVDDISYPIDLAIFDLTNTDTHRSNKSRLIKIPATAANQMILGRLEDVNISRTLTSIEGRIEYGNFVLHGQVKIYDVEMDGNEVYYNIQIISGNGDWVKQIEAKMITELTLDIEHTYDEATINASETSGGDYFYPLVNYGKFLGKIARDGDSVLIEDRLPAVKLFAIFYQIFKEIGYKIVSDFISDASGCDFIKWFMSFGRNPEVYTKDFCDDKLFCAGLSAAFQGDQTLAYDAANVDILLWSGNNNAVIAFDEESTSPHFDNGDNFALYTFTADYAMGYRFYSKIYVELSWDVLLHLTNVVITLTILKNGSTVLDSDSDTGLTDSTGTLNYFCNLQCDTRFQALAVSDTVTAVITVQGKVTNNGTMPGDDGDIQLVINPDDEVYFKNEVSQRPTRGYGWTVEKMLPDITQLAFIKAVGHIFNLKFTTNIRERTLYVEKWDDFFSSTVNNWSARLDLLRQAKILAKDIPTFLNYRMKHDRNDAQIINYYTEVKFSNGNGENEISDNKLFADTLMDYCRDIGLYTTKIPKLWSKKGVFDETPEQDMNFTPRLFYYDGQTAMPSAEGWYFEGTLMGTYPKVTIYNFEDFVAYRTNMHKLMNNSQIVQAYFRLTEADVNALEYAITGRDFRNPVYLDDTFFKGQYLINKVSGWIPEETCLVELVQFRRIAAGITVRQVEILNEGASDSGAGSSLKSDQILMTCLIVDPAIIAIITDEANWSAQNYTGSTAGLEECNYYIDWDLKIKYFFDGTHLVRFNINTIV